MKQRSKASVFCGVMAVVCMGSAILAINMGNFPLTFVLLGGSLASLFGIAVINRLMDERGAR